MNHLRAPVRVLASMLLFLYSPAFAEEKVLCELKWLSREKADSALQFVFVKEGCAMEGAPHGDCYIARKKAGNSWTLGEGVIQTRTPAKTLCLAPLLLSDLNAKIALICDDQEHPKSVRLNGPDGTSKTCLLSKGFPKVSPTPQ